MLSKAVKRLIRALPYRSTQLFDPSYYRNSNPEIGVWRFAPWLHFVLAGAYHGRSPHPLFDTAHYLRRYPDVAAIRANPLFHYLEHGASEKRTPHPLFDPDYYIRLCPEANLRGKDALEHFLERRGESCCNPHPLFDCRRYLQWHPSARDTNPLVHYVLHRPKEAYKGNRSETGPDEIGGKSTTRVVILHYHFFKNAGTTLEAILARNLHQRYCRLDTTDRDRILTHAELIAFLSARRETCAVSSHQIRYPAPEAAGFAFLDLCFLRDPLDRIRSMYDYFRDHADPGDTVSDLANNFSLRAYLERLVEHHPHLINDVQVRLLTGQSIGDPSPGRTDLKRAIAKMLNISFLGVVDLFTESVIAGEHLLRRFVPSFDCTYRATNVTQGMDNTLPVRLQKLRRLCGQRLFEKLVRLNVLDTELVTHAREEVMRRFKRVPDHPVRFSALTESVNAQSPVWHFSALHSAIAHMEQPQSTPDRRELLRRRS